jgi:hypothetical protein
VARLAARRSSGVAASGNGVEPLSAIPNEAKDSRDDATGARAADGKELSAVAEMQACDDGPMTATPLRPGA